MRELLSGRNFGHLASLLPDGSPHSVPVWILLEGDRVAGPEALLLIDRVVEKYRGKPFPMRTGVVYLIEAEHAGSITLPFRHD